MEPLKRREKPRWLPWLPAVWFHSTRNRTRKETATTLVNCHHVEEEQTPCGISLDTAITYLTLDIPSIMHPAGMISLSPMCISALLLLSFFQFHPSITSELSRLIQKKWPCFACWNSYCHSSMESLVQCGLSQRFFQAALTVFQTGLSVMLL